MDTFASVLGNDPAQCNRSESWLLILDELITTLNQAGGDYVTVRAGRRPTDDFMGWEFYTYSADCPAHTTDHWSIRWNESKISATITRRDGSTQGIRNESAFRPWLLTWLAWAVQEYYPTLDAKGIAAHYKAVDGDGEFMALALTRDYVDTLDLSWLSISSTVYVDVAAGTTRTLEHLKDQGPGATCVLTLPIMDDDYRRAVFATKATRSVRKERTDMVVKNPRQWWEFWRSDPEPTKQQVMAMVTEAVPLPDDYPRFETVSIRGLELVVDSYTLDRENHTVQLTVRYR